MNVAVVGLGAWGINHLRVFAAEPGCEVTWACDPSAAAHAREIAPRARFAPDVRDALADPAVDAVVIATPAVTHAEIACAALAAGKHVLVEKPIALDVPSAERIAGEARRAGRIALAGHLMLYHPAVIRLRDMLRAGELGELRYLHATRVNLGRHRSDENVLWSFGAHDVSMINFLIGAMPTSVAAHGASYLHPPIEDVVFVTLRFPGGVIAHLHLSWLDPRKERRLTLVGSHKMAEFDDVAPDKLRIFDRGYDRPPAFNHYAEYLTIRHGGVYIPALAMAEPLQLMARHFLACCRGEDLPHTDVASGVRVVRTLAAAQESLARGGQEVGLTP